MTAKACLFLLLASIAAVPAMSQVEPSATGGGPATLDDSEMMTPPPVSGTMFPNTSVAQTRTNYLAATITSDVAYIDNVLPGITATPASATTFSILPSLILNRTTPRQVATLTYSPTFTFYEPAPASALDAVDQSASMVFQDRLSPNVAISLQDFFVRTSNVFDQSFPFTSGGLTGSTQAPISAVIAPFAEQMSDTADGAITYQFGRNGMIGGGGTYSNLDFPNPTQTVGLYDSDGQGASAFYSRRFSRSNYAGLVYDFSRSLVTQLHPPIETLMHRLMPFYTFYINRTLSVSISAGMQHVAITDQQAPTTASWSPSVLASVGWQGTRGNFAASYLHTVTSGGGLLGAFYSDSVNAAGGWKVTRTWNLGLASSYSTISNVTQLVGLNYHGGNSLTAEASVTHSITEHLSVECGYDRLSQKYSGIAVISQNPDSDREFFTITYSLKRPLGR